MGRQRILDAPTLELVECTLESGQHRTRWIQGIDRVGLRDTATICLTPSRTWHSAHRITASAGMGSDGMAPIPGSASRHSFASHLAMRGATLEVAQELLGPSTITITITVRYAHLAPEVARDAVKLLDNLTDALQRRCSGCNKRSQLTEKIAPHLDLAG